MNIPHVEIPVRPGRDLARLTEVAALVRALKLMGHHPAQEFNQRLINVMAKSVKKDNENEAEAGTP